MSMPVLNLLADFFYSIFGNSLIIAGIIIFVLWAILLILRADMSVVLMIMIPLIMGFVINTTLSNFIEIPIWILITLFMVAGLTFTIILFFLR